MRVRAAPIVAALAALLVAAPVAGAHVTLQPPEWERGEFDLFTKDVTVPIEEE